MDIWKKMQEGKFLGLSGGGGMIGNKKHGGKYRDRTRTA